MTERDHTVLVPRGHRFRLWPNAAQRRQLTKEFGTARFIWNEALEMRAFMYQRYGKSVNAFELSAAFTEVKQDPDFAWMYEATRACGENALRDQDVAFTNFFKGRARHPKFKKKNDKQKVRYSLDARQNPCLPGKFLKLPNLGAVKVNWSRIPAGLPKMATVSMTPDGRYWISMMVEEVLDRWPQTGLVVGVDAGIKDVVVTNHGYKSGAPRATYRLERELRHEQRALARKTEGSRRRARQKRKVAKVHARIANRRNDFLHKESTKIATSGSIIALEDLNVAGMKKNRCLSKAVSDAGMGKLRRQIEYKAAWHGRTVVVIDRWFPSTKLCSGCGQLHDMPLSKRRMKCDCGVDIDRDVNAAINIAAEGVRSLADTVSAGSVKTRGGRYPLLGEHGSRSSVPRSVPIRKSRARAVQRQPCEKIGGNFKPPYPALRGPQLNHIVTPTRDDHRQAEERDLVAYSGIEHGCTTPASMLKLSFQEGDASAEIITSEKLVSNDLSKVINGFEAWSQIPIFAFNAQLVRKLRSPDRRTGDVHRIDFSHSEALRPLHIDIAPALLLSADGATQVAHYPGPREGRVLEVLCRIAFEQSCSIHSGDYIDSVRFTFALIRQHLKRHNHGINYPDIAFSLRILQNTRLSIFSKDMTDPLYEGAPLPQVIRDDSGTNRKEIVRIAEFPWPVAWMIGSANYRQLDYGVLMTLKRPIARWLYRRLCFRWINADMTNTYHFKFTTVLETGYLHSLRSDRQRKLIDQALDELVANDVIRSERGRKVVYGGARGIDILDVVYTVSATQEFTVAQRAANRRAKEGFVGDGAPGESASTHAGPMSIPARRVARETRRR